MKRTSILIALATGASLFFAGSALAATGTAQASVNIVAPLTVAQVLDMDFGVIAPPSTGGEDFTLSTGGVVSEGTGDGSHFSGGQAARFTVTGTNGQTVSVSPSVTTDFTDAGLSLGTLSADAGATLPLTGGADPVNIGGVLSVAAGATVGGAHSATIELEVLYQ